jgi:hypothetical protein
LRRPAELNALNHHMQALSARLGALLESRRVRNEELLADVEQRPLPLRVAGGAPPKP